MNNIFKPFWELFNRLTYPQKFTVVTVIFILPLIAFAPLALEQATRIDQYGRKELYGTLYLRATRELLDDVFQHQFTMVEYLNGDAPLAEVEAVQSQVDADLQELESVQAKYRSALQLNTEVEDIKAQWQTLKTSAPALGEDESAALHNQLTTDIHSLITKVGDTSFLILDPDLDTYYIMDAVLLKMPENQALMFQTLHLAQEAAHHQSLSSEEKAQLTILMDRLRANLSALERNIEVGLSNNASGALRPIVGKHLETYRANIDKFLAIIETRILNSPTVTLTTDDLIGAADEAKQAESEFNLAASLALETGIQARIDSLSIRLYSTLAIALLSVLAAFFIGQAMMRSISRPLIQLTSATQRLATGDMSARVPVTTTDEAGLVASAFNQMAEELETDRAAFQAHTRDLNAIRIQSEKRAQELQAISEISRAITTEQRLNILLPLITRLISERFDFYHTGIFFVDATKQFAVLQASNSEGGKQMLVRGHRLEVGLTGIVGAVSQTGKPRIALDVGADATFFNNPDLPETRSEMALPLNFRGETIGVLDVQSVKPGAFTEGDANTLSILADQVAIAIENARLFGQTQQAREEAEALYNQFQRTEWRNFSQEETTVGYSQSTIGGKPIVKLVDSAEIREALQKGQVVVFDGKNLKAQPSISLPVKLRGQTIGVLNIKAPTKNRKWNEDEINLAQAVSDRLALALDNARLLQESQRRASKEAKIGEVTAKIGASINMRNVLQTAVEELGRALPGSEIILQFEQVNNKDPHEE